MSGPAPAGASLHLSALINTRPVGATQVVLFALCALSLIMDGFDVQALGYTAPAIVQEWGVPSAALGPVFGAGNLGVLVGSLLLSVVADQVGRRPVLVGGTLFFALMTLLTATAGSVGELLVLRFISGIGLGSIIPQATALVGEYSPQRLRVALMMCITVGFTAGAAVGGFVAAWLIPTFGWRSVFVVGGAVPLVVAAAMWRWLPESLQFLVVRKRPRAETIFWLRRLAPELSVDEQTELTVDEVGRGGVPVVRLFREGRAGVTLLFWVVNFMNLLNLYSLASWLPTVVRNAGHPTRTAVLVGTALQVGGTLGTFGLAWLIAHWGFTRILGLSFLVATASIALIGQPSLPLAVLFVVVFVAGWSVVGSQPGINALGATYYPTELRSTGVGWGLGIGRLGAIVGPVIGGELMRRQWSAEDMFLAAALPAFVSALAMVRLHVLLCRGRLGS